MEKKGFSFTENNTRTIIDSMASQTKNIMEETVRKTEVITSKVTEGSGKNGVNIMYISIDEGKEEEGNKCF